MNTRKHDGDRIAASLDKSGIITNKNLGDGKFAINSIKYLVPNNSIPTVNKFAKSNHLQLNLNKMWS